MAGERKLGDLAMAFFIFVGCMGIFILVLVNFDNATNNSDAIGTKILYSSSELQNSYNLGNETVIDNTQTQLQSVTFNNNTFQAPVGQYIDTRGVSQGNLIVNNYPSTIVSFLKGIQKLFPFKGAGFIWFIIISMIVITGIVILIRFFQGSFKV